MKKRKIIINLFAAAALFVGCSESLEDTYSDFAGDGKIRYVAKCSDVQATAGWNRLIINWTNGNDATISNIKVVWSHENTKDSVLLPKESTTYELKGLTQDGTYRFDITAVNAKGEMSLKETIYARPYTVDHEIMLAFTRGVIKSYFRDNKMIFFSDLWNENIEYLYMEYTKKSDGTPGKFEFTQETSDQLIEIDDIDKDKPILVQRRGRPVGCPDIIPFEAHKLAVTNSYTAGFTHAIQRRYGYSRETKEDQARFDQFIENVESLEFDFDIDSFEDVLYCPKLKEIHWCKNRYTLLWRWYNDPLQYSRILSDERKSRIILNKVYNDFGVEIFEWGFRGQYFEQGGVEEGLLDFWSTYRDHPVLPKMEVIALEELADQSNGTKILCNPADLYADEDLNNLLDGNSKTLWVTTSRSDKARTYELIMQFKEPTKIDGIKVTQTWYDPTSDKKTSAFSPKTIVAQTSVDGANWTNVTFFETNDLGWTASETTLLRMVDQVTLQETPRTVRYLKFSVRDGIDQVGNSMISLGDIAPYRLVN